MSPTLLYLGNPEHLRDGVGDIFARKVMQIPNLVTVFFIGANLKFLKLLIFNQQQMSPKFLYLGNPEELRDGVGDIFDRKVMEISNLVTVFFIRANLKFLKLLIFNQQQMSPTFLYLGNPEELKDVVGDIFALKVMQIPNLVTVFLSEQI